MHLAFRRAAVAVLSTGAVLAVAAPAGAAGSFTLQGDATQTWSGGGTGAYVAYPVFGCESLTPADACDATAIEVVPSEHGPASLTLTMTPASELDDFDLWVYQDLNGDGVVGSDEPEVTNDEATTGAGAGAAEAITIPDAAGDYVVEIANFLSVEGAFDAEATLDSPEPPAEVTAARTAHRSQTLAAEAALARALAAARR